MRLSTPIISVIIPIYNSKDTLAITLNSLIKQTYSRLEIIIVDDCSTDDSLMLVNQYVEQMKKDSEAQVKVFLHEQNMGVASARNTGLDHATGEFICYVDADDWIEPNAIELMVDKAMTSKADIVGFNWWLSFKQNERKMKQPKFSDSRQVIEWMMIGKMRWNLWMFFVTRDLYTANSIRFIPDMNMGEDMMVMMKLFICADRVAYLDNALYHYGQSNINSLTKVYSEKHMKEVTYNMKELERFLVDSKFVDNSERLINGLKLNIKLPLLISNADSQFNRWRSWFPEVNSLAMANRHIAWRIRLLQWAASHKQDWILKLHYYLVNRLVYGVIYNDK